MQCSAVQCSAVQCGDCPLQAIVDLVLYYDWPSIIYIYQSSEGLYRLQKIYESIPKVIIIPIINTITTILVIKQE